ncbi:unnamed protein product, partial [Prorocentrum cordatum]
ARGPAAEAALSFMSTRSDIQSFEKLVTPKGGGVLEVSKASPLYVKQAMRLDAIAWQLKQIAQGARVDIGTRAFVSHLRRSLSAHGPWPDARRHEAALRLTPAPCWELHQHEIGPHWHRHLERCPSFELPDEIAKLKPFQAGVTIRMSVQRPLAPEPGRSWRPPQGKVLDWLSCLPGDGMPFVVAELVAGVCCYDAGARRWRRRRARRESCPAGARPAIQGPDPARWRSGFPCPGRPRPSTSIDDAELLALPAIPNHSAAPITARSDADYAVKGLLDRGLELTTFHEAASAE